MDWDDLRPPKTVTRPQIGEPLDAMAIQELEARLQALDAEIARVKAELLKKKAHSAAASAIFKK